MFFREEIFWLLYIFASCFSRKITIYTALQLDLEREIVIYFKFNILYWIKICQKAKEFFGKYDGVCISPGNRKNKSIKSKQKTNCLMTTKNKCFLIALAVLLINFSSCTNEEKIDAKSSVKINANGARISYDGSVMKYDVDPLIMSNFQHYSQRTANNNDLKRNGCGPYSYVMAASCIARYKGYTLNQFFQSGSDLPQETKAKHFVAKTGGVVPSYITDLKSYAYSYDRLTSTSATLVNTLLFSDANETNMRNFIEGQLQNNHFVIAVLSAYVYDANVVDGENLYLNGRSNPDYNISESLNSYISDKKPNNSSIGGHYVVITGLYKRVASVATIPYDIVEYVDPLAKTRTNNRKYCNYDRFIKSMLAASNVGVRNAISIY